MPGPAPPAPALCPAPSGPASLIQSRSCQPAGSSGLQRGRSGGTQAAWEASALPQPDHTALCPHSLLPAYCPALLTLVFEVLQDGDYGLQGDVVGQEELPGTILLKGFPV